MLFIKNRYKTLADLIIDLASRISGVGTPYKVEGDLPVFIPPLSLLRVLDFKCENSALVNEFNKSGIKAFPCFRSEDYRADSSESKFDIILLREEALNFFNQSAELLEKLLVDSGKLFVLIPELTHSSRIDLLKNFQKKDFLLIEERIIDGNHFLIFCPPRRFLAPEWKPNIFAKSLLIHSGWGYGDCIQSLRYGNIIRDKVGEIIYEARAELAGLVLASGIHDIVIKRGNPLPFHDYQISIASLIRIYGCQPQKIPYLEPKGLKDFTVDPAKFNVAFAYKGHHLKYSLRRYYNPQLFNLLLTIPRIQLYCIQKHTNPEESFSEKIPDVAIDSSSEINSWMDTASIVDKMNLVISPDTALAHLAAAMGKNTFVLMSQECETIYADNGESSSYYPEVMKIFRENNHDKLFNSIKNEIIKLINN